MTEAPLSSLSANSDDDPSSRVAFYDDEQAARVAVKMLVNSGFDANHVFVLCSNEKWTGDSLTTRKYIGDPQHDAATTFTATHGAGFGMVGGAVFFLFAPWPVAIITVILGGVLGAVIGGMLGAGTFANDSETLQLADRYREQVEKGQIVVVVKPEPGDDAAKMDRAADLLAAGAVQRRAAG